MAAGALAGCSSVDQGTPTQEPLPAQYRAETTTAAGGEGVTPAATASPTDAPAGTDAETATPTGTSGPPAPEVLEVALVDEWDDPDDFEDERIPNLRPGALVYGAARFAVPVHDGRVRAVVEARITRDGTLVADGRTRVDRAVAASDVVEEAAAVQFSTGPWENAQHTLAMQVRDPVTEYASEPVSTGFRVQPAAGGG